VCGAESGWVPVSATSPSMLLQQIEVARQEQGDAKAPILTPPSALAPRHPFFPGRSQP
jgi:TldD protein